jgi:hypothetical protein
MWNLSLVSESSVIRLISLSESGDDSWFAQNFFVAILNFSRSSGGQHNCAVPSVRSAFTARARLARWKRIVRIDWPYSDTGEIRILFQHTAQWHICIVWTMAWTGRTYFMQNTFILRRVQIITCQLRVLDDWSTQTINDAQHASAELANKGVYYEYLESHRHFCLQ